MTALYSSHVRNCSACCASMDEPAAAVARSGMGGVAPGLVGGTKAVKEWDAYAAGDKQRAR